MRYTGNLSQRKKSPRSACVVGTQQVLEPTWMDFHLRGFPSLFRKRDRAEKLVALPDPSLGEGLLALLLGTRTLLGAPGLVNLKKRIVGNSSGTRRELVGRLRHFLANKTRVQSIGLWVSMVPGTDMVPRRTSWGWASNPGRWIHELEFQVDVSIGTESTVRVLDHILCFLCSQTHAEESLQGRGSQNLF